MTLYNLPTPADKNIERCVQAVHALGQGRSNAVGHAVLSSGTQTLVFFENCSMDSIVLLAPNTSAAASSAIYASDVKNKGFTISHPTGMGGQTMGFLCIG